MWLKVWGKASSVMAAPEEVGHGSPLGNKLNCIPIESLHLHEIYSADKNTGCYLLQDIWINNNNGLNNID